MQGKIPVHALRGIDFSVEEGEYVAILGPSGSGKSTLLNLIGALDVPTKGKVFISGQDISELNSRKRAELRRTIGFVFQFYNLIPRISAFKNVELSLSVKNISRSERKKIVKKILTDVGLQDRMKHAPNELSGGQQQRVAIARALALDPTYLLMDEPTGNVDTKTRDMIMKLINQLNKEKGRTIIMITHDQFIAKDSDRIEYLVDGKLYHKPPKERIGYNTNSLKKQKLNDNKIIASEEKS
ncbi:MAG: ATP-binding cassette domain-containing protein [Candidatus Lokiarchaeota archaeon]|nr:ATP-binding cassette domain-containing protein [Candidatus Lokiarchaeota archaeon]MBD3199071.1 ATP-binding cassette domain-containing protein [Candidatus Lokiarchaeota archaeon]